MYIIEEWKKLKKDVSSYHIEQFLEYLNTKLSIRYSKTEVLGEFLYCLTYDQIYSPKFDPIVKECRGLIVDDQMRVIARPFDRFFNYGECEESDKNFDFSRAKFFEKVDGSLIKVYNFKGTWFVGTRGTCIADTPVLGYALTFLDLFLRDTRLNSFEALQRAMQYADPNNTYIMELASNENRVVTLYNEPQCVLLGIRNNETGQYHNEDEMKQFINRCGIPNLRMPEMFTFNDYDHIKKVLDDLPLLQEGFVGIDTESKVRVKLKAESYVILHHIRGNGIPSRKRIIDIVLANEQDEYLNYFKRDKIYFDPVVEQYNILTEQAYQLYERTKDIIDRKEFALLVKDHPLSAVLFYSYTNKIQLRYFKKLFEDNEQMKRVLKMQILNILGE